MRYGFRALLIAAIVAISSVALAQGLGLGFGLDDSRGGGHSLPATHVWLWNTNGNIIWNTNGNVLCNAC